MTDFQKELGRIADQVDQYILAQLKPRKPNTLWEAATHLPKTGGKKLRPFLTINTCKALGGTEQSALPVASALELIQVFSLIHDDIIDNDRLRRGVPTVHTKWGIPTAIVAGDLLHTKSYEILTEAAILDPVILKVLPQLLHEMNHGTIRICEGQQMDEELETISNPSESTYLDMIERKTAALFEISTAMGAILATTESSKIERMRLFGSRLGIAFQIVDDILGLVAEEKELGKPVGSDIREGKNTLLVIHAVAICSKKQKRIIMKALGNSKATLAQIRTATKEIVECGAVDYAHKTAASYAREAKSGLLALPSSSSRDLLDDVLDFVLSRRY